MYIHPDFKNYISGLLCVRCEETEKNCPRCLRNFYIFPSLTELANEHLKQFVEDEVAFIEYCRSRCAYCEQKTESCEQEKWANCLKNYKGELLDRFEFVNHQALCLV